MLKLNPSPPEDKNKKPIPVAGDLFFEPGARPHAWTLVEWKTLALHDKSYPRGRCAREDGETRDLPFVDGQLWRNGAPLLPMRGVCKVCGCSSERACPGGCWWAGPDLCDRHAGQGAA